MTLHCIGGFKIFEKTPHRFKRQDISDWVLHIFEKTAPVLGLRPESGTRHKSGRGPLKSLAQAVLGVNLGRSLSAAFSFVASTSFPPVVALLRHDVHT